MPVFLTFFNTGEGT